MNKQLLAYVARVGLRYLAGVLIGKGFIDSKLGMELFTDPELIQWATIGLGIGLGWLAEKLTDIARRFGWRT